MAIMISVPSRGTDTKKLINDAVKLKTKKLRRWLIASTILNIGLISCIAIHFIK